MCEKGKQEGKNAIPKRLHRCLGKWLKKINKAKLKGNWCC